MYTNLLFFNIPSLYYYINLRSSIIFCLSSRDIYLSSGDTYLSLGIPLIVVSELFYCEVFETFVILLAILLPIKSPVASAVFWITLFEVVLSASVLDYLAWSRGFWLYLPNGYLFLTMFLRIFLAKHP